MTKTTTIASSIVLLTFMFALPVQAGELLAPRERATVQDRLLLERLDNLLPKLMAESGIDCWLVICREYNEDPVFYSLMPAGTLSARRLTMLAFFLKDGRVERLSISPYDIGGFYRGAWNKGAEGQWAGLARVIAERGPKRIGVNRSRHYAHADGLSAFLEKELAAALPPELAGRLVDAEKLAVRWLETRIPAEEEAFRQTVAFTRGLIARAFSNEVIEPGHTSVDDLQWWMKTEMDRAGVKPWFFPHVDRKGRQDEGVANRGLIQPGDILHCDVGVVYLGLCSDIQELAYVLAPGETEPPAELKAGLAAANRFQDLVMEELRPGLSGNQVLAASLARAREDGLQGAFLYSHPLGLHGHAAGPTIGMWDDQGAHPGHGDWPVHDNTCYALELNLTWTIPGWAGQVRFGLEQDIWVNCVGNRYISGRQTAFHLVRSGRNSIQPGNKTIRSPGRK